MGAAEGRYVHPMFDWKQMICLVDRHGIKYNIETCRHIREGEPGKVILVVRERVANANPKVFVIDKPDNTPGHSLKKRKEKTPGFREYKFRYWDNITKYNKKQHLQHIMGPFHLMPSKCTEERCGPNPGHT